MVARVHDPIDGWGGRSRPPATKWSRTLHATIKHNTTRPRRQKGAHTCLTQSGGGGEGGIYPQPTPSEVMPRYDTYNPLCARLSFKVIQTKQSKHMYLLTKLSASQTAAWHVYFRIYHTYKSILTMSKRGTWGRCWRVERAASTWHAACFRPLGAVQKGLFLSPCIQFNTAMPKPVWFWHAGRLDGVHVGPRLK
jgi:hypothetical protein